MPVKRYRPSPSVCVVRVSFVFTLRTVTAAFVTMACFSSLTSPEMEPVVCAKIGDARNASKATDKKTSLVTLFIRFYSFAQKAFGENAGCDESRIFSSPSHDRQQTFQLTRSNDASA